jgi:hypothetical protein
LKTIWINTKVGQVISVKDKNFEIVLSKKKVQMRNNRVFFFVETLMVSGHKNTFLVSKNTKTKIL